MLMLFYIVVSAKFLNYSYPLHLPTQVDAEHSFHLLERLRVSAKECQVAFEPLRAREVRELVLDRRCRVVELINLVLHSSFVW